MSCINNAFLVFTLLQTFDKTYFFEDGVGVVPLDFENKLRYELQKGFISAFSCVRPNYSTDKIRLTSSDEARHKDHILIG